MYSVPFKFGFPFNPTIANPAAGADFLYLLPNNKRYQIAALRFTLTTDANVANRNVALIINNLAVNKIIIPTPVAQAANTSYKYQYLIGDYVNGVLPSNNVMLSLPRDFSILGNWNITSSTVNIQVGDQISGIEILFNTWVERTV